MTGWVVFDYGEVLCRRTTALPELAGRLDVPPATFEPAYWAHRDPYDRGASDVAYWQAVADTVDTAVDVQAVHELTAIDARGWSQLDPDAERLVEALAESGRRLAVLSNAPASFARHAEQQPWTRHFEQLIFSGDVGMAKPDAEIYRLLVQRLGCAPGDCLFFDDRRRNVDAARMAGLRAEVWPGAEIAKSMLL
ncbi:putative hydrolase of the HAD superfamily [Prauserella sediminis]|uniref:Putative hydrolase of the HAD superfamily n=1 Tax=Prauserella sediminis TaxID=577680 RepID=A0A839XGA4_9PSEU|nr:HAD family phosphatase [Prauserella sediminis]MBB3662982.1 putative hydrolase of the HAD superfamily [Prauserella sediminis]